MRNAQTCRKHVGNVAYAITRTSWNSNLRYAALHKDAKPDATRIAESLNRATSDRRDMPQHDAIRQRFSQFGAFTAEDVADAYGIS